MTAPDPLVALLHEVYQQGLDPEEAAPFLRKALDAERERAAALVKALRVAYQRVHSVHDGECEHGFGPPATLCPNVDCDERALAEAWQALGGPR